MAPFNPGAVVAASIAGVLHPCGRIGFANRMTWATTRVCHTRVTHQSGGHPILDTLFLSLFDSDANLDLLLRECGRRFLTAPPSAPEEYSAKVTGSDPPPALGFGLSCTAPDSPPDEK
eukprot:1185900-Prorocentrum_minimum.AAC.2